METKRYNVFNQIHKALRLMMFDTATAIQRTDFCKTEEAFPVIHNLEKVLDTFDRHAEHEDTYILPHVVKFSNQMVEELEGDHEDDHALSRELKTLISAWKNSSSIVERQLIGKSISYSFNEFIAFNLYHMNKEEGKLNMLLWEKYTDQEILEMEQRILESHDPQLLIETSRWMMRAISNQEVVEWLQGVKMGAPQPVFDAFLTMSREELPVERWMKINEAMLETS